MSLRNAWLLRVRVRAEEEALGEFWRQAFAGRPRFVRSRPAGGSTVRRQSESWRALRTFTGDWVASLLVRTRYVASAFLRFTGGLRF